MNHVFAPPPNFKKRKVAETYLKIEFYSFIQGLFWSIKKSTAKLKRNTTPLQLHITSQNSVRIKTKLNHNTKTSTKHYQVCIINWKSIISIIFSHLLPIKLIRLINCSVGFLAFIGTHASHSTATYCYCLFLQKECLLSQEFQAIGFEFLSELGEGQDGAGAGVLMAGGYSHICIERKCTCMGGLFCQCEPAQDEGGQNFLPKNTGHGWSLHWWV